MNLLHMVRVTHESDSVVKRVTASGSSPRRTWLERHVLEHLAQRAAHRDPHVAQVLRLAFVHQGLGTHPAHPGHGAAHHAHDVGDR